MRDALDKYFHRADQAKEQANPRERARAGPRWMDRDEDDDGRELTAEVRDAAQDLLRMLAGSRV